MAAKKSRKRRKPGKPGVSGNDQSTAITAQPLPLTNEDPQPQFTTTYSPILDMPMDVLNLIMDNISELHHLLDISLASRALNAVAAPVLYNTIALYPNTGPLHQIPQLLRTLMSRPDLCGHVKTVVIGTAGRPRAIPYPTKHSPYFPYPLGRINLLPAEGLICQTGMSHAGCWAEHFKKGDMEAALTLLLTLLPNLRSLTIEPQYNESAPFLSLAIRGALRLGKARDKTHDKTNVMFDSLEIVSFKKSTHCPAPWSWWDDATALSVYGACSPARTDWTNYAALSLFYLPNLREISVSVEATMNHNGNEFWPFGAPELSSLEVLEINRIRENTFGAVLAICPELKKLTWTIRYDPTDAEKIYSNGPIDRDQVVAALTAVSTTLTDLTINTWKFADWRPGGIFPGRAVGPSGSFKALRKFGSIKTLTVPWFLLVDHDESSSWGLGDVLPRNLEHLLITDRETLKEQHLCIAPDLRDLTVHFAVYAAIRDWLRNWRDITPRLKSFSIDLEHTTTGKWAKRIRRELKKLCRRVGVEHHQDSDWDSDDEDWRIPAGWEW